MKERWRESCRAATGREPPEPCRLTAVGAVTFLARHHKCRDTARSTAITASEGSARLSGVLGRVGAKAVYTYDFGDSWEHGIVVEKRLAAEPGRAYPVCLAGERHGPPEDCGGIPGFYNLLEAIGDPAHEEHEELLEWVGEFDAEYFSVEEVNGGLARLRRGWSKGAG